MVSTLTRRAFLVLPVVTVFHVTRAEAAGVHLTGRLDATETERTEQMANFGKACALVVNDKALWAALEPMLGQEVQLSVFVP